jgi:queuine tRNA-ribosyltransferase
VTPNGEFSTPAFMPVGTKAAVKGLITGQLLELKTTVVLANTYHLYLRPGSDLIRRLGGLHRFMNWNGPILTDSGGYQIFSLSDLRKVTQEGVRFKSHLDGSEHQFTPEVSMAVQKDLGANLLMVLDDCPPYPVAEEQAKSSLDITNQWAERCRKVELNAGQALLGIVQGSTFAKLREESARTLVQIGFDGYAVGGLSLGESRELKREMVEASLAYLPEERIHYLMGVGTPEEIVSAVSQGIDLFDCVLPTRNARNGYLFTSQGPVVIKQNRYREDPDPIDPECECYVCRHYSRAYLRHLFLSGEINSAILNTYHNVHFYLRLMERIRESIANDTFEELRQCYS